MKSLQIDIKTQIIKLNEDYQKGKLNINHKQYLAKYKKLKNANGITNQARRFGAQIKKHPTYVYHYIYEGVNFTAIFNSEACETTWWEVNLYDDNVDKKVIDYFEENNYERKGDVVQALLNLDQDWNHF